ncbi:MAG: hypothetical protein RJB39_423 [Candidatus Parcubacteria bacterium]|jgi:hypothetical protein
MTLLTWVGLSSAQIFTYIEAQKRFFSHRDDVRDLISCVDVALDYEVRQPFHAATTTYTFPRNLSLTDHVLCFVKNKTKNSFDISTTKNFLPYISVFSTIENGFVRDIRAKYHP